VTAKTERREPTSAAIAERRYEPRVRLHLPIEVSGFDLRRRFFTERTLTLDVSNSGCRFSPHAQVEDHSAIAVRVLLHNRGEETDLRPALFEVLRVERTGSGCTLAAIKLQTGRVWPVGLLGEEDEANNIL
jgi:hypothetical protein